MNTKLIDATYDYEKQIYLYTNGAINYEYDCCFPCYYCKSPTQYFSNTKYYGNYKCLNCGKITKVN